MNGQNGNKSLIKMECDACMMGFEGGNGSALWLVAANGK